MSLPATCQVTGSPSLTDDQKVDLIDQFTDDLFLNPEGLWELASGIEDIKELAWLHYRTRGYGRTGSGEGRQGERGEEEV